MLSEEEYGQALVRIHELMTAESGTPEGEELDRWVTLVEAYEEELYPLGSEWI